MEIFKDVRGFEGIYRISNLGNIESAERAFDSDNKFQNNKIVKRKILKTFISRGYLAIRLCKDKKRYGKKVHRLVCECFVEGEQIGLVINHKNKNKLDNRAENLEWCTQTHNMIHGIGKPVIQVRIEDNSVINEFLSGTEASRCLGIQNRDISNVCLGKAKTAGGYKWKFKNI